MAGRKVLGCIRVSTATQAGNGAALEVQQEAIAGFCRQQRWQLVRVVEDPGLSGEIKERPGLVEVEEALRSGGAEAVVIHRFDRLARDLIVQELTSAGWTAPGAADSPAAGSPSGMTWWAAPWW